MSAPVSVSPDTTHPSNRHLPAPKARLAIPGRLAAVDGLRAVAATWVVLFHMRAFSGAQFGGVLRPVDLLIRSGSTGVSLFLVLSGFCLYVPFAAGRQDRFKSGAFFIRRARRLMPAYYVSLLATMAIVLIGGTRLNFSAMDLPTILWQSVAHIFMLHSLFPSTFYALNGAYWSLGLEWQLYLALPFLIWLTVKRGFVVSVTLVIACNVVYRVALTIALKEGLVPNDVNLQQAVLPNFILGRWAEFGYGMVAAELYKSGWLANHGKRYSLALIPLVPAGFLLQETQFAHLVFGLVFAITLLLVLSEDNIVSHTLAWRPIAQLGVMSYSLYLVHAPLLWMMAFLLKTQAHFSATRTMLALIALSPAVLGIA
ncbi:MAG TPA: acyltransferase, partial [Candidatus Dormibacteraeota bacterium]|nr:acyltransferase [Candidatus Dormibacteraeota bacterium]